MTIEIDSLFADALARQEAALLAARLTEAWSPAVAWLRTWLTENVQAQIREAMAAAATQLIERPGTIPDWPAGYSVWGMGLRNGLREHGYGEAAFGIDNLDDIYVALVEEAVTK